MTRPFLALGRTSHRRSPIGRLLLLVALAASAVLIPTGTALAEAEDQPWEATLIVSKYLDADGDLSTLFDRGLAEAGWEFAVSVVGSDDDPIMTATDDGGQAEVVLRVTADAAQVQVVEATSDPQLLQVTLAAPDEETIELPFEDQSVTFTIDRDAGSRWWLGFASIGVPLVDARIAAWVDRDGKLGSHDDLLPGAGWIYDIDASGPATTEPSTVDTTLSGGSGAFRIAMVQAPTTLRITQRGRAGYQLLDAHANSINGVMPSTLAGRTLTVDVDAGVGELSVDFINRQTASAPSVSPIATLPATDVAAAMSPSRPVEGILMLLLVGIGAVGLLALRSLRRPRGPTAGWVDRRASGTR